MRERERERVKVRDRGRLRDIERETEWYSQWRWRGVRKRRYNRIGKKEDINVISQYKLIVILKLTHCVLHVAVIYTIIMLLLLLSRLTCL